MDIFLGINANYLNIPLFINKKAMTYMDYENKGRKKLVEDFSNSDCEIEYEFTDIALSVDCFATACTGQKFAIEVKDRDIPIEKYSTYLLEMRKYNALMAAHNDSGYTPLYRCYFQDGVLTWDVSKIDINDRVEELKCTQTTVDYGQKVVKKLIMLKEEEAINDKKRGGKHNR